MSAEKTNPMVSSGPVRLLALHEQARPAVKELNQVITILGAGDGADLILGSSRVDAAHTAIVSLPGGTYACDLGAPGGTVLGGRRIRWSRLADGDQLAIGPFSFRVQLEDDLHETALNIPVFQLRNDQTIGTIASSEAAMVIGSDPCCDIMLNDSTISPRHALVVWTREGTIVRDLTGRSSVRHNGRCVQWSGIVSGDTIGIGPYEMIYETQTSVASGATTVTPTAPATSAPPVAATVTQSHEISPIPWLDESHFEFEPTASYKASEIDGESPLDRYADDEAHDFAEVEQTPTEIESQADEGQEMAAQRYSNGNSSVEQCPPELKARVAAAQRALDERARKLREELEADRAQLKACQDKLQEQARQLLEVAKQRHGESRAMRRERFEELEGTPQSYANAKSDDDSYDEVPVPAQPSAHAGSAPPNWQPDVSVLENIFAGKFDVAAGSKPSEGRSADTPGVSESVAGGDESASLQQRVSELVNMVRYEKEEMHLAESRLESLRFEIDRLRGTVLRAKEKHQVQEAEHEARYAALKRSQSAIQHERESLMTQMRRLDSKETALSSRVQEAEQIRRDLDIESERLHRAQEQHDERLRELRINLEGERHRLRVRQAELQRKAADLAKLTRVRRKAIEQIVTQQQSELKEQESELKAKRSAVAEAGRAELERAATELEQLLSARLADVETEVLSRQENLDNSLMAILDAAKPITDSAVGAKTPTAPPATSYKFEPISVRPSAAGAKIDGERGHMADLEKELEGLHRAVRKLEEDSERCSIWQESGLSRSGDRSTSQIDRRLDSVFASKFNEKIASIRKGLIDIGPCKTESVSMPAAASSDKPVGANG